MIIPNDDGEQQPKEPAKSTRVPAVKETTVPETYQSKVNEMLLKMAIDQVIRIARVCKPDNQPMFIQAVKNFIVTQPHGGGILFGNDFKTFKRHRMFHEYENETHVHSGKPKNDPALVTKRNGLIRWFRIYQKTFDNAPFTIGCATYNDPNKAINNFITNAKNTHTRSAVFAAAINHLITIKNHI